MLGYGKSAKPGTFPYTTEAMAEVVREVLHTEGIQDAILIGHSMGGQVALSYAIQFPDQLKALVLTSPAGFEQFDPKEKAWFRSVFTTSLIRSTSEYGIWGSIRRNNFSRWSPDYEWLIEERVRMVDNLDFEAYAYANVRSVHGLANNDFVRTNLGRVGVPTLIIHGDEDRLIPNPFLHGGSTKDVMEYGREQIPDATLMTLEGCGHTVQIDCWRTYNVIVDRFLRTKLAMR